MTRHDEERGTCWIEELAQTNGFRRSVSRKSGAQPDGNTSSTEAIALEADIFAPVCCPSFRATGITVYLKNKETLETAQKITGSNETLLHIHWSRAASVIHAPPCSEAERFGVIYLPRSLASQFEARAI